MEKLKFTINDEKKECDILYTFHSDKTGHDYLICTDHTETENELNIYSFLYDPNDKKKSLQPIESEEDWNEVEKFIDMTGVDYDD